MDLTYTARNQLATQTRYSDLGGLNKVASNTLTYDTVGRLTNLQDFNATGGSIANYTYTYDLASRLQCEQLNGGATKTYTYDAANELTNDGTNTYSYDLNGNRTMTGYTTGPGNQLTNDGVWTYTYDAEGNLTKKSKGANAETWTFAYDNHNHVVCAKDSASDGGTVLTLATYVYDSLENRQEKDVWTSASNSVTITRFSYDGEQVWADRDGTNTLVARYLHGDQVDELFARINSSGIAAWYLADRVGSVRDIIANTGSVLDHIDYDGFGNATETQPANGDRYKWTGREFDLETGLLYARARYYSGSAGRWTSQDPISFGGADSNLYRYVANDAPNRIDPSGLAEFDFNEAVAKLRAFGQAATMLKKAASDMKVNAIEIRLATERELKVMPATSNGAWSPDPPPAIIIRPNAPISTDMAASLLLFETIRASMYKEKTEFMKRVAAGQVGREEFARTQEDYSLKYIKMHHKMVQDAIKTKGWADETDGWKDRLAKWKTLDDYLKDNQAHTQQIREQWDAFYKKAWEQAQRQKGGKQ
jgi:RHS repeat-associated protein